MARTATQAVAVAVADKYNKPGYCLQQVRLWYNIPSRYGTAASAWRNAKRRHAGHRSPPKGATVFWSGGPHNYGHVAISLGNGLIRHTDSAGRGRVGTTTLSWPERRWGLRYAGWTEDLNGVMLPGLRVTPNNTPQAPVKARRYGNGRVYWNRLKRGQTNSDSVRNLQQRLNELGIRVSVTGNYEAKTQAAVKAYQARTAALKSDADGQIYPGGRMTTKLLFPASAGFKVIWS